MTDPWQFQAACVDACVASWRARGFSPVTIDNDIGLLERTLAALGRPAWDVTPADIDRVVGDLAVKGRVTSTGASTCRSSRGSTGSFRPARPPRSSPYSVSGWSARSTSSTPPGISATTAALVPPPAPERVAECFDFMKQRIATARKYGPGLDLVLRWFLEDVRCKFPESPVLFADESGGSLHRGTTRNRLRYQMDLEGRPTSERFSPYVLRRACATRNYERCVDLVAVQQMLGHWTVSSTMRHVRPSATFIEDARQRAVAGALAELTGKDTTA